MKNRFFALLCALALTLSVAAFVGCGDKPSDDNTGGTVENPSENTGGEETNDKLPEIAQVRIVTESGDDVTSRDYVACTVAVSGAAVSEYNFEPAAAEIRVRGNNTAEYDKKPYRIKFNKKRGMLGLNDDAECKSWVLLAEWKDTSMLRNALAYRLGNGILRDDLYCTDFRFTEVYVNDNYNGLYLLAEQQQVNKNRVDVAEPDEGYTGTDIGYFIEYDGYYTSEPEDERFRITTPELTCQDGTLETAVHVFPSWKFDASGYVVKNDIYSTAQRDFIKDYMQNAFDIMYKAVYNNEFYKFNADYTAIEKGTFASAKDAIAAAIDLESYVDMYILQDVCCDNDLNWSSFFMSADMSASGNKKLTFEAPWDFDSAFGLMKTSVEKDVQNKIFAANADMVLPGVNPWTTVLAEADWFWDMVNERWQQLISDGVLTDALEFIDKCTDEYEAAFAKNFDRWTDCMGDLPDPEMAALAADFTTQREAAEYLRDWLKGRIEFLSKEYPCL